MKDTPSEIFCFAEGEETTRRDWFLSYLGRQPKVVSFGKVDMDEDPGAVSSWAVVVP